MNNLAQIGDNKPPTDEEILKTKLADEEAELRKGLPTLAIPEKIISDEVAGNVTDYIKNIKLVQKKVGEKHKTNKEPFLKLGKIVDGWKNKLEEEFEKDILKVTIPLTAFLREKAEAERLRLLAIAEAERKASEELQRQAEAHANAGIADTANDLLDAAVDCEAEAARIVNNAISAKPADLARTRSYGGSTASQKLTWTGEIENKAIIDLEKLRFHLSDDAIQVAINRYVANGGRELAGVKIYEKSSLNIR